MRLIELDGSGGNQDRSLSATRSSSPASITIVKDAIPNDAQDFSFTTTGGLSPASFSLDDDSNGRCPIRSSIRASPTSRITRYRGSAAGWALSYGTPVCSVTSANGGIQSGNVGTRTVSITLKEGENVSCKFINTRQSATLTVIKHVINDNGGTKTASDFTMNVTATNPSDASFPGAEDPARRSAWTPVVTASTRMRSAVTRSRSVPTARARLLRAAVRPARSRTTTSLRRSTVIKHVVNDNGGTKVASDFTMIVTGSNAV